MQSINIPDNDQKRIVILGAGFAGLTLARRLSKSDYQVVLIDKNNYHQFQPLFYQVAMAGLEPSSIVFPLRKIFQKKKNVFVRVTEAQRIDADKNTLHTSLGPIHYDELVVALGADTNFYGNEELKKNVIPMKSVSEALHLRNSIFEDYEKAVTVSDYTARQNFLDIVIVGGGATGVEVAGALAEMKRYIIPKDYHDLNEGEIEIHLVHGNEKLLQNMSPQASKKAEDFLRDLGVNLWLNKRVTGYDGELVKMKSGETIRAKKVIWAAGITANKLEGLPEDCTTYGCRYECDNFNRIKGYENIYALGDIAYMEDEEWPKGHPQVAQVAIQQAENLAKNLKNQKKGKAFKTFRYKDLGSMATIGRHRAVCDLPFWRFQGAFAWIVWLFVHLFAILGVKNKFFIFMNWVINYVTYDQSLRLVIKPFRRNKD